MKAAAMLLGLALASAAPAWGIDIDARTLGCGGIWTLGRLESSPGCPDSSRSRFGLGLDLASLYVGVDLGAATLHLQRRIAALAIAVAVSQVRAPLGSETTAAAALQLRAGALHVGVGAAARALHVEATGTDPWLVVPRFGLGLQRTRLRAAAVLVLETPATARFAAGFEYILTPQLVVLAQVERQPAVASGSRLGFEWRAARACVRAGYDDATAACTLGLGCRWGGQSIAWGARSHPELGWSHAWTYARP